MSFIQKKIVTNEKINFWNLTNFFTVGVGLFFYYFKIFQTTSPQQTSHHIVIY